MTDPYAENYLHLISENARVEITECCGIPCHNELGERIGGTTYNRALVNCPEWLRTQARLELINQFAEDLVKNRRASYQGIDDLAMTMALDLLKQRIVAGTATAYEITRFIRAGGVLPIIKDEFGRPTNDEFIEKVKNGEITVNRSREIRDERDRAMKAETEQEIKIAGRPGWHTYFLGIAESVARRADCTRRQVGAVVVDANHRVIGTGYNGGYSGGPSCLAGECPRAREQVAPGSSYDTGAGSCISLHAEQNALLFSDYTARIGGTIYITHEPCDGCLRMLNGSGLKTGVWTTEPGFFNYVDLPYVKDK